MGEDHTYRYVNATNVYNKGRNDGRRGSITPVNNATDYEYTINTGLSSITFCYIYIGLTNKGSTDYNYIVSFVYDKGQTSLGASKYLLTNGSTSGGGGSVYNIGSRGPGDSENTYGPGITSVSGGTIKFKTYSNTYGVSTKAHWVAY